MRLKTAHSHLSEHQTGRRGIQVALNILPILLRSKWRGTRVALRPELCWKFVPFSHRKFDRQSKPKNLSPYLRTPYAASRQKWKEKGQRFQWLLRRNMTPPLKKHASDFFCAVKNSLFPDRWT